MNKFTKHLLTGAGVIAGAVIVVACYQFAMWLYPGMADDMARDTGLPWLLAAAFTAFMGWLVIGLGTFLAGVILVAAGKVIHSLWGIVRYQRLNDSAREVLGFVGGLAIIVAALVVYGVARLGLGELLAPLTKDDIEILVLVMVVVVVCWIRKVHRSRRLQ